MRKVRVVAGMAVAGAVLGMGMGPAAQAYASEPQTAPPPGAPPDGSTAGAAPGGGAADGTQSTPPPDTGESSATDPGAAAPPDGSAATGSDGSSSGDSTSTPPPATGTTDAGTDSGSGGATTSTTVPSTTSQQATVAATGTAEANTGANVNAVVTTPAGSPGTGTGSDGTSIGTGPSSATGNDTVDSIVQTVSANVRDAAQVRVLQIALVVNIGIAVAESGANAAVVAATGPGGAPGAAGIDTGPVNATGNTGSTKVLQVVVITGGHLVDQSADVITLGIGLANSGANVALVAPGNGAVSSASPTGATAMVATGSAGATGNQSASQIIQIVTVAAHDQGVITALQRAIVINFGGALAVSGLNQAGVGGALPAPEQQIILALLSALASPDALPGSGATAAVGGGTAAVGTGAAQALGNATNTQVRQELNGSVQGTDQARSLQDAFVANIGLALANSGANAAGVAGTGPWIPTDQLDAARSQLLGFLAAVGGATGGTPYGGLDSTLQLGSGSVHFDGNVSSFEELLGLSPDDWQGGPGSLLVRQVSAVLNLSFAFGDSGSNRAITLTDGDRMMVVAGVPSSGDGGPGIASTASIRTGSATAVGNRFVVVVCQADGATNACDSAPDTPPTNPPGPPTTPPGGPSVEPTVVARTPEASGPRHPVVVSRGPGSATALPNTGIDMMTELGMGVAFVAMGAAFHRRSKRGLVGGGTHKG